MVLAAIGILAAFQTPPARVVVMDATLGGKQYGTVTYVRQILPGKGVERTVTMKVDEDGAKYEIQEKRTYAFGGGPTSLERTYTEGARRVVVTVVYSGLQASVTYTEGTEKDTDQMTLTKEGATLSDPSQFWFSGSVPAVKSEAVFWEFSIDDNAWVERKVRYEGEASLKVGDKTVQAYRISIGAETNFYVDVNGMPLKSVEKTSKGDLVMVRTKPEVGP